MNGGAVAFNSTINQASALDEFSFIQLHEAFEREILRDLNERRSLKSVDENPLIVL